VGLAAQMHGIGGSTAILWKIALVTAVCQLCFDYNDVYDLNVVQSSQELVVRLLQGSGAAALVLAAACAAVPSIMLDASTFVTGLGVFVTAIAVAGADRASVCRVGGCMSRRRTRHV
jgi:hypothetical protein